MTTQTQPTQSELDAHWGYLYRIIHKQSGRQYIGQHRHKVGEDFEDYYGSGSIITSAILFEGRDAFKKEFICFVESEAVATVREIEAISALVSSGTPYYNIMFTDAELALYSIPGVVEGLQEVFAHPERTRTVPRRTRRRPTSDDA